MRANAVAHRADRATTSSRRESMAKGRGREWGWEEQQSTETRWRCGARPLRLPIPIASSTRLVAFCFLVDALIPATTRRTASLDSASASRRPADSRSVHSLGSTRSGSIRSLRLLRVHCIQRRRWGSIASSVSVCYGIAALIPRSRVSAAVHGSVVGVGMEWRKNKHKKSQREAARAVQIGAALTPSPVQFGPLVHTSAALTTILEGTDIAANERMADCAISALPDYHPHSMDGSFSASRKGQTRRESCAAGGFG